MLYDNKPLGQSSLFARVLALFHRSRRRRLADLDLAVLNPHLRRDLGLNDGERGPGRFENREWK